MIICTNNNCAVKCKVRSFKSSGEGFVGICAYTHRNAYDSHLNEQVKKKERVPTTGTFVRVWSLWLLLATLVTVAAACHIVGMVHFFLQIIIATCLFLTDRL